jgi:alanyl-tRNA synthetase
VTGRYAEQLVQQEEDLLNSLGTLLKVPAQLVQDKVQALLDENRLLTQELKVLRKGQLKALLAKCLSSKENVGAISFVAAQVEMQAEELNEFANDLLSQMKSGVVALGVTIGERCQLLVAVSPDLVQKNVHAQMLIKEAAPFIQGGGGGKQNMAQAGGKDPQGLPKALDKIRHLLKDVK